MTDYLAKAQEMCPKKSYVDELNDETEQIEQVEEEWNEGFNNCLALCLPIVADLLKRVDSLQQAHNYNIDKIAELEEEVERLKRIVDKIPLNIYNRMIV